MYLEQNQDKFQSCHHLINNDINLSEYKDLGYVFKTKLRQNFSHVII